MNPVLRGANRLPAANFVPARHTRRRYITAPSCQGTNSFWP